MPKILDFRELLKVYKLGKISMEEVLQKAKEDLKNRCDKIILNSRQKHQKF